MFKIYTYCPLFWDRRTKIINKGSKILFSKLWVVFSKQSFFTFQLLGRWRVFKTQSNRGDYYLDMLPLCARRDGVIILSTPLFAQGYNLIARGRRRIQMGSNQLHSIVRLVRPRNT